MIGARVPVRYHENNHMTHDGEECSNIDMSHLEAGEGELLNLREKWVHD